MTIDECTASIKAATARLQEFRLRSMLAIEFAIMPSWTPKRKRTHTVRTTYLRRDYNANDVAMLEKIVEAQPRTFTFEQITAERKFKADADQIKRIRKGQL